MSDDPLYGPIPSPAAQEKFGRIIDALLGGLKNTVEFPGRAMQNGLTTDQAVDWAAPMAMGMVGSPGTPAGALGSTVRPYANVPDSLMGFRRNGPQVGFHESGYPASVPVEVVLDKNNIFTDAIKGMNKDHAIERAFRNWPGAWNIRATE